MQFLQAVDENCKDPMVVIYYISPSSALAMTPMALWDILREDLKGAHLTSAAIAEVAVVIVGAGLFSFMLIFAEVSVRLLEITKRVLVIGWRYVL